MFAISNMKKNVGDSILNVKGEVVNLIKNILRVLYHQIVIKDKGRSG
jgi:hypothetical protein